MTLDFLARLLVGILPVLCFLGCLIYLDSYKLVPLRAVLYAIGAGALVAVLSYVFNSTALEKFVLEDVTVRRYIAPVFEELFKAVALAYLIRSKRVGFLVDAAIYGFAIGAGFALVENIHYLKELADSRFVVWIVRGFGTAIMHGGTTAIFGIISKTLTEEKDSEAPVWFVPGLLAAVVAHSLFNHFYISPVLSTTAVILFLPPLIFVVFQRSEASLQKWLGVGFDADAELLKLIHSGEFSRSRIGEYLQSLRDRFRGEILADMLCYLRLYVELSLRAKGILLMRESGFSAPLDPETHAKFDELRYLERSIGKTGRLAIEPFLHTSGRDLWQLHMLERE